MFSVKVCLLNTNITFKWSWCPSPFCFDNIPILKEWELYIDGSYHKYRNAECRVLTNWMLVTDILFKWQKSGPLNWDLILKNTISDRTGQIVALSAFSMQIWNDLPYWSVFENLILVFTSLADGVSVTSVFWTDIRQSGNSYFTDSR